jgi:hypothetical protein
MCECGCGDMRPLGKFPAPKRGWYVLEIYPGCGDCHVGPGVVVHHFTAKEMREELAHLSIPDFLWINGPRQIAVPVLEAEQISEAVKHEMGDEEYDDLTMGGDPFSLEVIRTAVLATLASYDRREGERMKKAAATREGGA